MVRRKLLKQFEEYNSKDLYSYWKDQYRQKYGTEYFSRVFIGKEFSLLKTLLEKYDIFTILLAINEAIRNNQKTIQFFVFNVEKYIYSSDHPDIDFFVKAYGKQEHQDLLFRLKLLDSTWFPKPEDKIAQKRIEESLRDWIEGLKDDTTNKFESVEGSSQ